MIYTIISPDEQKCFYESEAAEKRLTKYYIRCLYNRN
jgi:hypothetical protein